MLGEKKGGVPILSNFLAIFEFRKFLQVFDISRGKKTLFFKKCSNNGLVSEKKLHFFIFFIEGFPKGEGYLVNFLVTLSCTQFITKVMGLSVSSSML